MALKIFIVLLATLLLTFSDPTHAQQPAKIPRIGYLSGASFSTLAARIEAFRLGLRELGYVEGKNIVIEWRSAEGNLDRVSEIAAELVRLKVELIVSPGPAVTRPLKEATSTIPIVMASDTDPSDGQRPAGGRPNRRSWYTTARVSCSSASSGCRNGGRGTAAYGWVAR